MIYLPMFMNLSVLLWCAYCILLYTYGSVWIISRHKRCFDGLIALQFRSLCDFITRWLLYESVAGFRSLKRGGQRPVVYTTLLAHNPLHDDRLQRLRTRPALLWRWLNDAGESVLGISKAASEWIIIIIIVVVVVVVVVVFINAWRWCYDIPTYINYIIHNAKTMCGAVHAVIIYVVMVFTTIVFTENRRVRCTHTHTLIIGQRISEKGGFRPTICWQPSSTPTAVKATAAAAAANENVGLSINRSLGATSRRQIVCIFV